MVAQEMRVWSHNEILEGDIFYLHFSASEIPIEKQNTY